MAEFSQDGVGGLKLSYLSGTRCRLQRLSDLRFYSGWINRATESEIEIDLPEAAVQVGDKFQCEAAYEQAMARFVCRCTAAEGGRINIEIEGPIEFGTPGQEPRFRVFGMGATIYGQEKPIECDVADVSMSGIGLIAGSQLPRFASVRLVIDGPMDRIECKGMVRYCRPHPQDKGSYRLGVTLDIEDRLARAMWSRIVVTAGSQSNKAA